MTGPTTPDKREEERKRKKEEREKKEEEERKRKEASQAWSNLGAEFSLNTKWADDNVSAKQAFLIAMYNNLYSELRDKDTRVVQVVAWGITGLSATILTTLLSASSGPAITTYGARILTGVVIGFTLTLGLLGYHIANDRAAIARQLNRMHQVMLAFTPGAYYGGNTFPYTTIFNPSWQGWGHKKFRDANTLVGLIYGVLLVAVAIAAILLIWGREGDLEIFVPKPKAP